MSVKLAHQTQKTAGIGNGMRTATIAAVNGNAVTLSISGGLITSGVGVVDSYTPSVGDVVAVFRQDSSWLVLGAITPPASGLGPRNTYTGAISVSFTSLPNTFIAVNFGVTFPVPPAVFPNIDSNAGSTALWGSRATAITTTGFLLYLFQPTGIAATWASVQVSWIAVARS